MQQEFIVVTTYRAVYVTLSFVMLYISIIFFYNYYSAVVWETCILIQGRFQ